MNVKLNRDRNKKQGFHLQETNFFVLTMPFLLILISLSSLGAVWADSGGQNKKMDHSKHHKTSTGSMKMTSCNPMVHLTQEAEHQLGGAMYQGKIPMKDGSMDMDHMKMKGMHQDHNEKMGGVFFMAPNKIHHLEATYSQKCGFQLFLYNAFTKSIRVERFQAFVIFTKESNGEKMELIRFLSPNEKNSFLQVPAQKEWKPPFEIELKLKFPESEKVEGFNFEVDEQGRFS